MVDMDGRNREIKLRLRFEHEGTTYLVYITDTEVMISIPDGAIEYYGVVTVEGYRQNIVTLPVELVQHITANMLKMRVKENLDAMTDEEYLNFTTFSV